MTSEHPPAASPEWAPGAPPGTRLPPPAALADSAEDLVGIAGKMAGLGGWQLDLRRHLVLWSREVAITHGMRGIRELPERRALSLYLPGSRRRFQAVLEACSARGESFDAEFELVTPAGQCVWTRAIGQALRDDRGEVIAVQGACQNITEHKHARSEAQRLSTQLWTTLESITDAFLLLDRGGRICYVNKQFERAVGRSREGLVGELLWQALAEARGTPLESELRRALKSGEQVDFETLLPAPADKWLLVRLFPSPEGFAIYLRDITADKARQAEQAQRDQQARQAQKLESLGALAGGVAHEFNNMLGAILGNLGLAMELVPAGHPARDNLSQVQYASLRARELVQRILSFSRPLPAGGEQAATPLRPIVEESIKLLRAMLPSSVELRACLQEGQPASFVDPTSLQQVLVNLCTNAWQALPEGRGVIELGLEVLDAARAARGRQATVGPGGGPGAPAGPCQPGEDAVPPLPPGPLVRLWVKDEGSGMDAATQARIFDPFFTTKARGSGTGLGLSIVHGIVKAHQGEITVRTALGQGACFSVWLPLAEPEALPARGAPAPKPVLPSDGRGRLVFIVDDDPIVLLTSEQILLRRGYRVQPFEVAAEAVARLAQDPGAVAALITDFSMPGLSGLDVAREAQRLRPGLPVILSSGYISDEVRALAGQAGVAALLYKENLFDDLAERVGTLLDPPTPVD